METVNDKIDNAVHAAFMAMGLSINTSLEFADMLTDWLSVHAPQYVTDDSEDE